MEFIKDKHDNSKYVDALFTIANLARADKDKSTINATLGTFYGEDEKLLTYPVIFEEESKMLPSQKAGYAQGAQGNKEFNVAISKFVLDGKVNHSRCLAVAGGTGGISLSISMCLDDGDTIYMPKIAWGNYNLIAKENNLNVINYDPYNIDSLLDAINDDKKTFIVINSPCENPCGCSFEYEDWKKLIDKVNTFKNEVIILNDAAYMDYSNNSDYKKYFELFNNTNRNVLVLIAYSCSKSFSYYGFRLGALLLINNDEELLDTLENQFAKHNRTIWSSVNNGAMINVANIINNHLDEYLKQKNESVELLRQRSKLFIDEANECGLETYPYKEGFFVTLKLENNDVRDIAHQKLIDNHIYTIKVNNGIRVGICALPLNKIKGLAKRIKEVINI